MKYSETKEAQDKIDPLMKACVAEWSKIPGITTIMSCQSHFYDDDDFDQCEQVEEFVEEGSYPYIAFVVRDERAWDSIMLFLPSNANFTIERRDQVGEWYHVYYLGFPYEDEQYRDDTGRRVDVTREDRKNAIQTLMQIAENSNNPGGIK